MEERTYKDNSLIESSFIDFQDIFSSIKRRKKIFTIISSFIILISIISLFYRRINSPQYLATFSIMIKDPILDNERDMGTGGSGFIENIAVNNTASDIPTLVQYLKSEEILSKTSDIGGINPLSLKSRIKITIPFNASIRGKPPSIIKVNVSWPNKLELEKITKSLSNNYLNIAADRKKEKLTEGIKFLNKEKPILERKANKLQNKLESFRSNNKVLDPIEEGAILVDSITLIKNKIFALESEEVRLKFVKDKLIKGILFTEGVVKKDGLLNIIGSDQLLLKEILDIKSLLADAQSKYKKTSSVVLNLQAKLNQLEPILLENQKAAVDAAILIIKAEIESSRNNLKELELEFAKFPELINNYSKIIREVSLIQENLDGLLSARESLELELSQGTTPWKLISKPFVNPRPFKPEVKKELINALLISLFAGFSIALLVDKLDDVYHSIDEIENDKSLISILGFIPFFKIEKETKEDETNEANNLNIKDLIQKQNKNNTLNFIFEETFRNIYTSIKFSSSETNIKTLCITSSVPSEGKTSFSAMLGLNTSELDKKVLVIDGDLRRPTLHEKFSSDNISGLSNMLTDENSNWKNYLRYIDNYPNLSFITGGKVPPNAMKLLNSKRMKTILEDIKGSNQFDLIIIDSPPLLGLSDSVIISEFMDAVVLTISLRKVKRNLVQEALKKINLTRSNFIGVVVNNVEESKDSTISNIPQFGYANKYFPQEVNERYSNINYEEKKTKNKNSYLEKFKLIKNKVIKWLSE